MTLLALPGVIVAGAAPAAASQGSTPPAAAHSGKPVPVRPPSSRGADLGAATPAKPHQAGGIRSLTAWTVTLTASPNVLWPTQYSTLTATANMDVGPTPYYLRIYDDTAGAWIIACGRGTTCTTSVTEPMPATHYYKAVVADSSGVQASSNDMAVVWHGVFLSLSADPATLPVGSASTLTATTSTDIGPSPFWTGIYDATTGTRLAVCGTGTSCSTTVSQNIATTHEYIAYLSNDNPAYPPTGIQETSPISFVTWSNLAWRVSLSAPLTTYGAETVTATANGNVGPTPYYIEIFDETGTRLAECGSGISCSVTFTPSYSGSQLVAFISGYSTAFPPTGIVASSNEVTTDLRIIP